MRKLTNAIINLIDSVPKLLLLVIFYIALRDVAVTVPFLNVITQGLENRLVIVWLLALLMYKFSHNSIVTWIVIFLFLSIYGIHVGLTIYASLILVFIKLLREMR